MIFVYGIMRAMKAIRFKQMAQEPMTTGKALEGTPYAENPHVRFDEGAGAPKRSGRSALLYKIRVALVLAGVAAVSVAEGTNAPSANPDTLVHYERMMFNNPGLEVDLSLGIWCHAAVYDYDKDGKMDIVANASCCPFVSRKVRGKICRLYLAPTEAHEGKDVPISARCPPKRGPQLDTGGVKNPHPRPNRGLRLNVVDFDTDGVEDVVFTVSDWTHYGAVGPACPYAYTSDGVWKMCRRKMCRRRFARGIACAVGLLSAAVGRSA